MKKVKLKSYKELEKEGYIYHNDGNRLVITNGKGSYKVLPPNAFDIEFTVAESEDVISEKEFICLKNLFQNVE